MKRALDLALGGAFLIGATPVLALASLAIRLESPGPVLFRHTRIGRGGRPFHTLKLRTMVDGADSRGSQITSAGDQRITRIGRILRRAKIDELPQLWNVLRGEMSLVGPRPEVARYVELYPPEWRALLSVRPGLTDIASLIFRDEERLLSKAHDRERAYREVILPMKSTLALSGVANSSLGYDLRILARTAITVALGPTREYRALLAEAERNIEQLNEANEG
jgi:lipopolysaccharide/colanic/teichoic acid biosynthesis glycosyltransferase